MPVVRGSALPRTSPRGQWNDVRLVLRCDRRRLEKGGHVAETESHLGGDAGLRSKLGVRAGGKPELAPRRIRINVVSPGATRTPIWGPPEALAATEKRVARSTPLVRLSEAEEVARAILYLASDDAANIMAEELMIDGGATGAPAGAPIYRG